MPLNFSLVEEHPYITVAVVAGGGLLLYLYWSSSFSSASGSTSSVASSTGTTGSAVDPNVLSAQVSENQTSTAAQFAALQANDTLAATQFGYGESADVSALQSNNALAAAFGGFQTQDFAVGAQQQVANASTQSQIQLAEIAAGLPLSYTMAAGGPFSAQYAGSTTTGGTVPTNNPTSSPSQTVTVGGTNGPVPTLNITQGSNPPLGTNPNPGINWNPLTNLANVFKDTGTQAANVTAATPAAFGGTYITVPIDANNLGEGYTQTTVF